MKNNIPPFFSSTTTSHALNSLDIKSNSKKSKWLLGSTAQTAPHHFLSFSPSLMDVHNTVSKTLLANFPCNACVTSIQPSRTHSIKYLDSSSVVFDFISFRKKRNKQEKKRKETKVIPISKQIRGYKLMGHTDMAPDIGNNLLSSTSKKGQGVRNEVLHKRS